MEQIVNIIIKHNTIYIPQRFLNILKIKNNDRVLLRCNSNGLMLSRQDLFSDLDMLFNSVENALKTKK